MNKIRVYVLEDMTIPRMSLETMLLENGFELSGSSATAEEAKKELEKNRTDLILLDINLAGQKNGIWLAKKVRENYNIPIIYLTAYSDAQTIKDLLETKPNGYLMKPYQEAVLLTTIEIAITNFKETQSKISEEYVFIKDKFLKIKLYFNDILYVKSEGNYLEIFIKEKKYVIRDKLLGFKKELPDSLFFQSHQRYIFNRTKIAALKKNFITIDNVDIPISKKFKKEIEELFL